MRWILIAAAIGITIGGCTLNHDPFHPVPPEDIAAGKADPSTVIVIERYEIKVTK